MMATRVDLRSCRHDSRRVLHHDLHSQHPRESQRQTRRHPLDGLFGLDHAVHRLGPTSYQGLPMREQQANEFGKHLTQDAFRLATGPGIQLAVLLAQFPVQLALPA